MSQCSYWLCRNTLTYIADRRYLQQIAHRSFNISRTKRTGRSGSVECRVNRLRAGDGRVLSVRTWRWRNDDRIDVGLSTDCVMMRGLSTLSKSGRMGTRLDIRRLMNTVKRPLNTYFYTALCIMIVRLPFVCLRMITFNKRIWWWWWW